MDEHKLSKFARYCDSQWDRWISECRELGFVCEFEAAGYAKLASNRWQLVSSGEAAYLEKQLELGFVISTLRIRDYVNERDCHWARAIAEGTELGFVTLNSFTATVLAETHAYQLFASGSERIYKIHQKQQGHCLKKLGFDGCDDGFGNIGCNSDCYLRPIVAKTDANRKGDPQYNHQPQSGTDLVVQLPDGFQLVAQHKHDHVYPGIQIVLRPPGGDDALVAWVEYNGGREDYCDDQRLRILAWYSNSDEPVFNMAYFTGEIEDL